MAGEVVTFDAFEGDAAFTTSAIVREQDDVMNAESGGAGSVGPYAVLKVDDATAARLREGRRLTAKTISWRIASPGTSDGRAMVLFDLERV
jgi:hypothetical protein